jgi:hypothetical protein
MKRLEILVVLFLVSLSVYAQQTGRLTGTVLDPAGAAVPNASVSLYLPEGSSPLLKTTTNSAGIFDLIAVRPDLYTLQIESPSFAKYTVRDVRVEPVRQLTLPDIKLSLASTSQTVEVTASAQGITLATAEVASTTTQEQIRNLPVLDRQISNLFVLQAGVAQNGRANTVINGMRPSYSNLFVDGVNIQDSVRINDLDNIPNRITIAQVAEFTVSTTNSSPTIGGAASTFTLVTPSGGNQYHGSLYWYNRNNYFAANDWFNNKNGVGRPFLNSNEFGGTVGGPIKRDKLFFWANYEGLRRPATTPVNNTILTPTARQGILEYKVGGAVQQFNVLSASGLQISPFMQKLLDQVPTTGNNSAIGDQLNTTGYSFNGRNKHTRDNVTGKLDYNLTPKHVFSVTYAWNREIVDRPDLTPFYGVVPPVFNDNTAKLFSASYRWTPTATLTNELRGGFNRAPSLFSLNSPSPGYVLATGLATAGMQFSSPIQSGEVGEGRNVNWYGIYDNANWVKGRHTVSFGFQTFQQRVGSFNYNGAVPTYTIGISSASPYGFTAGNIPGASSTDVSRANGLLATLAGLLTSGSQQFNPTSTTSGFVKGAPQVNNFAYNNYALYVLDNFKVLRNLTLTLGLRWDYFPPVDETSGLIVQPVVQNNNAPATLLGNATLDLTGSGAGRQITKQDKNNFAPNVGFAWDPFRKGTTSIRGGYSVAFLNDNTLNSVFNTLTVNNGLFITRGINNLTSRADAPTPVDTPPFALPTTSLAQFNLSPASPPVEGLVDPNLATPYVEQWNFSVEHDLKGWVFEGRYVGNHVVKGLRQIDFNQVDVNRGGFLQDFIRARNNGFLAQNATGTFNPNYNPAIAGSQLLTFFPQLPGGGLLTNATVQGLLRTGEPGSLAQLYQDQTTPFFPANIPGFSYFPNPLLLYSSMLTNTSNSTYNAGQFEVRKRTRNGFQFQANYTFSKALTNTFQQRGIEANLDNGNPSIEKGVANFDQRHAFKFNHYYPLPFGASNKFHFSNKGLDRIIDGWALSGFLAIYSGNPIEARSQRGTLNRGARSAENTVDSPLTYSQLRDITGLFMRGDGPYWIDPSHINPANQQGVAADGQPAFAGQVFFNPQPGSLGSLQRRTLFGPGYWNDDLSVSKNTKITERQSLELHVDFFNVFNHPNFFINDQNVNTAGFGKITAQNYNSAGVGPRLIQFGLYYRF